MAIEPRRDPASPLEWAQTYASFGACLIPISHRSKAPHVEGWQNWRLTRDELRQYFNGQLQNIGLLNGEPSGNIQDVDLDTVEAVRAAETFLPTTGWISGRPSKPRSHRFYRTDEPARTRKFVDIDGRATLLELRSTGTQTIVPCSTHPSGEDVVWYAFEVPARADTSLLSRAVAFTAVAALLARHWPGEGIRHEVTKAVAGFLLRQGVGQADTETIIETVVKMKDDPGEVSDRVRAVRDTARRIAMGQAATGGPELMRLLPGLGDKLLARMQEWIGPAGAPPVLSFPPTNGQETNTESSGFSIVALRDFLLQEDEATAYVVQDMLPEAGLSLLAAKPKVGKTTLLRQLAVCVGRGERFLGRQTRAGRVLFLAFEEKRGELRKHLRWLQPDGDAEVDLHVGLAPLDALDALQRAVYTGGYSLVIIDTLQRLLRLPDLNDYGRVSNALEPVVGIARDSGTHILFAHHANKIGGESGDAVLGSTAIFGTVDTLMEVRRDTSGTRTIWTQQRYGIDLEQSILEMDATTHHVGLAGSKADHDLAGARREILAFLNRHAGWHTREEVKEGTPGMREQLRGDALRSLGEDKSIARDGTGKKGSPFRYAFPACIERETEPKSDPATTASRCQCTRLYVVRGDGTRRCPDCDITLESTNA